MSISRDYQVIGRTITPPFEEFDDSADITLLIGGKKLYVHSWLLKNISPVFCELVKSAKNEATDRENFDIEMNDDVSHTNIVNILQFYYPNQNLDLSDKPFGVLVNLFETCYQFDCRHMKQVLYKQVEEASKSMVVQHRRNVVIPTDFAKLLSIVKSPEMKRMVINPDVLKKNLKYLTSLGITQLNCSADIKFEVMLWGLKKFSISEDKIVDLASILNFLKIYFYEGRTADLSYTDSLQCDHTETYLGDYQLTYPNGDYQIVVEGYTLTVNSSALSLSSPVFKAMLNSSFMEANMRRMEMPDKKLEDVLELMNHLHYPKEIDGKSNIFGLLPLSREYQINWLTQKIGKYMESTLASPLTFNRVVLKYFGAAEVYGFTKLKENILKNDFCYNFSEIRILPEFNSLTDEAQIEFVCKTIVKSAVDDRFANELLRLFKEQRPPPVCISPCKRKREE